MATFPRIALTVLASAWLIVVVSPRHRRVLRRRLAEARRLVSHHRIVDGDERALDAWEDEGGLIQGTTVRETYSEPRSKS